MFDREAWMALAQTALIGALLAMLAVGAAKLGILISSSAQRW